MYYTASFSFPPFLSFFFFCFFLSSFFLLYFASTIAVVIYRTIYTFPGLVNEFQAILLLLITTRCLFSTCVCNKQYLSDIDSFFSAYLVLN